MNLRLRKAKDQHAGSFDEPQDVGVGVGVEFDRYGNRWIDAVGDFVRPGLELGRRFVASSRAQHKRSGDELLLFVEPVDKTALIQLADESHIDKLFGLG